MVRPILDTNNSNMIKIRNFQALFDNTEQKADDQPMTHEEVEVMQQAPVEETGASFINEGPYDSL